MIYLDNAATTWPKPESVYRMAAKWLRKGGNPGRGEYPGAVAGARIIYQAREEIAGLFKIENPLQVIFTYNATDAINMALLGQLRPGDRVVTTAIEHNAVVRPLSYLATQGVTVKVISCDPSGRPDMASLAELLKTRPALLVMSHASNVTGTILPIAEAGRLAARYGVGFMVDAAQTAGVEDIDVKKMKISLLAFAGHKGLLGPPGTGGLYIAENIAVRPLRYGGTGSRSEYDYQPDFLPDKLESGTPNTPGIAGLLAGVRFVRRTGPAKIRNWEKLLAGQLRRGLSKLAGVKIYGPEDDDERTAVVSFAIAGRDSGEVAGRLAAEYGIVCRAGLHCAPWAHRTIKSLPAGTIRFSPGYFNTQEEIEQALAAVRAITEGSERN